jgi:hypothetical protein
MTDDVSKELQEALDRAEKQEKGTQREDRPSGEDVGQEARDRENAELDQWYDDWNAGKPTAKEEAERGQEE